MQIGAVQRREKIALIVCHKRDVCFWTYEGESAANKEKKAYIPIRGYIAASTRKTVFQKLLSVIVLLIIWFGLLT